MTSKLGLISMSRIMQFFLFLKLVSLYLFFTLCMFFLLSNISWVCITWKRIPQLCPFRILQVFVLLNLIELVFLWIYFVLSETQIKTQSGSICWMLDANDAWSLLSLSFNGLPLAQISLLSRMPWKGCWFWEIRPLCCDGSTTLDAGELCFVWIVWKLYYWNLGHCLKVVTLDVHYSLLSFVTITCYMCMRQREEC